MNDGEFSKYRIVVLSIGFARDRWDVEKPSDSASDPDTDNVFDPFVGRFIKREVINLT